jgi:hypothetical protein
LADLVNGRGAKRSFQQSDVFSPTRLKVRETQLDGNVNVDMNYYAEGFGFAVIKIDNSGETSEANMHLTFTD